MWCELGVFELEVNKTLDYIVKKCEMCGITFTVPNTKRNRDGKRTCSRSCSAKLGARNSKKISVNCKICLEEFSLSKHNVQKTGNFCSDKCRKKRHEAECVSCGKMFRADRNTTKICSIECRTNHSKNKIIKRECACCNEIFERPSFTMPSNKRVFCSNKCNAKQFSRENPSRYGSRWSGIREKKVKIDGYKCNRCGEERFEPYGLNVHHIVPIDEFENIDDANIESNLETLCYECHMDHHDREILSV